MDHQHIYLFEMRNGKRKLAYGSSPEDALAILRLRLTDDEMAQILPDRHTRIPQSKLHEHIASLG